MAVQPFFTQLVTSAKLAHCPPLSFIPTMPPPRSQPRIVQSSLIHITLTIHNQFFCSEEKQKREMVSQKSLWVVQWFHAACKKNKKKIVVFPKIPQSTIQRLLWFLTTCTTSTSILLHSIVLVHLLIGMTSARTILNK